MNKKTIYATAFCIALVTLCSCQATTTPKVTYEPDLPVVTDPSAYTTEAPSDSETLSNVTDTTEAITTAPDETSPITEEDRLLDALLSQWKKINNNGSPEHTYKSKDIMIAYMFFSETNTYSCMLAHYNEDGSISCIPSIYISNETMKTPYSSAYHYVTSFEAALETIITTCTFTDQKMLLSTKNNSPNNVESFEVNDFAGKYIVKVVDGVVFDEKGTELILFPPGRTGSYTVPDGVTKIEDGAFNYSKLSEVILPASVTELGTAFDNAVNVKIIQAKNN